MRASSSRLLAALACVALAAGAARAVPPPQARAALEALARGDNESAARLFTQILLYGRPTGAEREQAYVKRAQAFLALGRDADALADARRALALDPHDAEAAAVRDKASPPPPRATLAAAPVATTGQGDPSDALNAKIKANLDAVEARNKAAFDKYQADVAAYEAQKADIATKAQADQDAWAASLAAHDAQVQAVKDQHEAEMDAWRRRVAACKRGDTAQCRD